MPILPPRYPHAALGLLEDVAGVVVDVEGPQLRRIHEALVFGAAVFADQPVGRATKAVARGNEPRPLHEQAGLALVLRPGGRLQLVAALHRVGLVSLVQRLLQARGVELARPYIEINQRSGTFHAFPDVLCVAVLEYYAFDAPNTRDEAKKNFRLLAGKALQDFIYTQVGYDPNEHVPDAWKQFHDRVSLTYNAVPSGYFGVFKEIADMIVTLGQAGLHIDQSFLPDGSVGTHWANHWNGQGLESAHGERIKFDHNYPEYFPQAASNPQNAWCYPESALGEFRRWFRDVYIGQGKMAKYLNTKVSRRELPPSFAQLAILAYENKN